MFQRSICHDVDLQARYDCFETFEALLSSNNTRYNSESANTFGQFTTFSDAIAVS